MASLDYYRTTAASKKVPVNTCYVPLLTQDVMEEIIWNNNPKSNFLEDLKSFASSLDYYSIAFDIVKEDGKHIVFENGSYQLVNNASDSSFECPVCSSKSFEVLEGEFEGKSVVGLACLNCETYGAVFPNGL